MTDIDIMADMYDARYPDDIEINQRKFKAFWAEHQQYHTYCLPCITRRKEEAIRQKYASHTLDEEFQSKSRMFGKGIGGTIGEDEYPDWGPVFLTEASQAILLNWLQRAKGARQARKDKRRASGRMANYQPQNRMPPTDTPTAASTPWTRSDAIPDKNKSIKYYSTNTNANNSNNNNNQGIYGLATRAIAVRWMRTARARLQKKTGKEGKYKSISTREEDED